MNLSAIGARPEDPRRAIERRIIRALVAAAGLAASVVVTGLAGGCSSPDAALLDAAHSFANRTVGPEYLRYVADDPRLNPDEKRVRAMHVEQFRRAVTAAGTGFGGGGWEE